MRSILIALVVNLAACTATPTTIVDENTVQETICPKNSNALQVCTMEFVPVCGQQVDKTWRTYSNGCDACANDATKYLPDACEYQGQ